MLSAFFMPNTIGLRPAERGPRSKAEIVRGSEQAVSPVEQVLPAKGNLVPIPQEIFPCRPE